MLELHAPSRFRQHNLGGGSHALQRQPPPVVRLQRWPSATRFVCLYSSAIAVHPTVGASGLGRHRRGRWDVFVLHVAMGRAYPPRGGVLRLGGRALDGALQLGLRGMGWGSGNANHLRGGAAGLAFTPRDAETRHGSRLTQLGTNARRQACGLLGS